MPFDNKQRPINSTVILSTALVKVLDPSGYFVMARALLDSGSQLNFISEQLIRKLHVKRIKEFVPISGIGLSSTASKYSTIVRVQSHRADVDATWKFNILPKITMELPHQKIDISHLDIPTDIVLADPLFNERSKIDLIIGVEIFYDLLRDGQIKFGPNQPLLQNTALGWIVSGRVSSQHIQPSIANVAHESIPFIEQQLVRFWEIESCQTNSVLSREESLCEEHFAKTTARDSSGRFVVAVPKKEAVISRIGNSKNIASRRFMSLERRLLSNPELKEAYSKFIHEYSQLGHMKLIDDANESGQSILTYYIPHHCVVKPDSITTKLRVVFDASCSSDTGVSLNDALMVGPQVQDDLLSIILRFRIPQFAIIADIEKMYRQILVAEADQPLQRIVWRDSPTQPLQTYQLTTVTYGTSAAPYLATKCLQKLRKDGSIIYPEAAVIIRNDVYMDDLLSGADSINKGKELCSQLIELANSAGLQFRKWASNSHEILESVPIHLRDERTLFELDSSCASIKTLGLQWDILSDKFLFEIPKHSRNLPLTKRVVLSDIARLFDPLGLVGPVVIQAKLFMQELWKEGKDWDDSLNDNYHLRWINFRNNLSDLAKLEIPRWMMTSFTNECTEYHGFCDASERAYGACIYVRTISSDGSIYVRLLTAKSKVAPIGKTKKDTTYNPATTSDGTKGSSVNGPGRRKSTA
ncbi:uncharacterized protein LOC129774399 [Toxorhynchites rutilus septentrionalis]|uniref:uncharacterized protein LOC129774399 n=1 Tax=Toxorhynchites rutilus septentrionalis TaxID=329112 RepID=UPI00247982CB|nr:uncharacterized protein LOC129774399 [Toxorhynchites rutilus septentrionalis]